jgi:hypothetical protein
VHPGEHPERRVGDLGAIETEVGELGPLRVAQPRIAIGRAWPPVTSAGSLPTVVISPSTTSIAARAASLLSSSRYCLSAPRSGA